MGPCGPNSQDFMDKSIHTDGISLVSEDNSLDLWSQFWEVKKVQTEKIKIFQFKKKIKNPTLNLKMQCY